MKKALLVATLAGSLLAPTLGHAVPGGQALGVCLSDSLTGKERKNLAKWIYLSMSTHSTIAPYSDVTREDIKASSQYVGGLVTRLLTEDCPEEAQAAIESGGSRAFEFAFGVVGQMAMQEIMAEPSVSESLGLFEQYLDQDKFNQVFK